MRIATSQVSIPADIKSLDRKSGIRNQKTAAFNSKVSSSKASLNKSTIIPRDQLLSLASDFKNGLIDREEANKRFVAAVVDNSLKNKLGEQDLKKIMEDIEDFFSNDQDFIQKLAKNLQDLA